MQEADHGGSGQRLAGASLVVAVVIAVGVAVGGCTVESGTIVDLSSEEPQENEPMPSEPISSDPAQRASTSPFLRVLGTAQDGGLPHAACEGPRCRRAREDPSFRRLIASLALVIPETGAAYLFDATPDIREQLDALSDVRRPPQDRVDRAPVDGVFLTHAHVGHYLGLAFFGFEAVHTEGLPVYVTPRMAEFLTTNGPWSQLVEIGNIALEELASGARVELAGGVAVEALAVPHRDEYADTLAFVIHGPRRSVLYVPDTDSWIAWPPDELTTTMERVDVAIVDATFYSADEMPGRAVESIGHPLMTDSMERFGERVRGGDLEVYFTHLNHSNPAVDPASGARQATDEAGFAVLSDGQEIEL